MELFANDLSIREKFHDVSSFLDALKGLMVMRNTARRFGREVHCHRDLSNAKPIPNMPMQKVVQRLPKSQQQAVMSWLDRTGPFWDDLRCHGGADWLECRGDVVTDSAVGEAAYRQLHSVECGLVSFTTSDWDYSPVEVIWKREDEGLDDRKARLENWRDAAALENGLQAAAAPLQSWDDLRDTSTNRFRCLTFAGDCFEPLKGVPFAKGAAERFVVLLDILDRLAHAFDENGRRTPEAQQIYEDYFKGGNALFTDSSTSEKNTFRNELTFPHPGDPGNTLFCTWHGKVRTMTLRLHYWWSGKSGAPVYVVYAGPKITRQ